MWVGIIGGPESIDPFIFIRLSVDNYLTSYSFISLSSSFPCVFVAEYDVIFSIYTGCLGY